MLTIDRPVENSSGTEQSQMVHYEQPLNERIRTLLRLELLFNQCRFFMRGESLYESRVAITSLLDILNIFNRNDLKTEIMKELERHSTVLSRLERSPGVDHDRLHRVLNKIDPLLQQLHQNPGLVAQSLRSNDFLNSVKQRSTIPGGDCPFDLPVYHHWLNRASGERIQHLSQWMSEFSSLEKAVILILELTRQSARPSQMLAENGFYNRSLDPNVPCQMLRIGMPAGSDLFPEISGGKHRFSVRFLKTSNFDRPNQVQEDVTFELTCCMI